MQVSVSTWALGGVPLQNHPKTECVRVREHTLSSRQNVRSHCWLLPRGAAPVTCPQGAGSSQDWNAFSTSSPALLHSTLPTPRIQRSLTYRLGGPLLAKSPVHLSDYNDGSLPCAPHTTRHPGPTHLSGASAGPRPPRK